MRSVTSCFTVVTFLGEALGPVVEPAYRGIREFLQREYQLESFGDEAVGRAVQWFSHCLERPLVRPAPKEGNGSPFTIQHPFQALPPNPPSIPLE